MLFALLLLWRIFITLLLYGRFKMIIKWNSK
jgi:hypothetical protein